MSDTPSNLPKPKKSVALSGTAAGNTALCTVGRSGNDLHYRGYDIKDLATRSTFEEVAHMRIERAGGALQPASLGDHVVGLSSLDRRHRHHRIGDRVDIA